MRMLFWSFVMDLALTAILAAIYFIIRWVVKGFRAKQDDA